MLKSLTCTKLVESAGVTCIQCLTTLIDILGQWDVINTANSVHKTAEISDST